MAENPKSRRPLNLMVVFSRKLLASQRQSWMIKLVGGRGQLTQGEWRPLHQARRRHVSAWLALAESRASLARSANMAASGGVGGGGGSENVLKYLAEELLSREELADFKRALQHFRVSRSVASLCSKLQTVISTSDKLILLLELSCRLPRSLQRDFHKLCTLTFHNYEPFLRYFNPSVLAPGPDTGSKVIAQDSSGQFQVVSSGFEKSLQVGRAGEVNGTDLQSLPGTSATSGVYSEADDVARLDDTMDAGVANDVSDDVRNARMSRRDAAPNRSATSRERNSSTDENAPTRRPPLPPTLHRARKYHTMSKLSSSASPAAGTQVDSGRRRVLLKRREDGSLGVGIKGGREYGSPIVVFVVEANSQAEKQGLQVNDTIVDVNGTDFGNITHAEAVTLMRNAWNLIITVEKAKTTPGDTVNKRKEEGGRDVVVYPNADGKMGCGVFRNASGSLLVSEVEENSPASKAGLTTGDSIAKIDGASIAALTDVQIATLIRAKRVLLHLESRDKSSTRKTQSETVISDDIFSFSDDDTDESAASHQNGRNYVKATSAAVPGHVTAPRSASASKPPQAPAQRLYQPRSHSPSHLHSPALFPSQHGHRSHSASRQQAASPSERRQVMVYHAKGSKPAASSKERRPRSSSRGLKLRVMRDRSPSPVFTGRRITVPLAGTDREVLQAVQRAIDVRQRARRRSVFHNDPVGDEWKI